MERSEDPGKHFLNIKSEAEITGVIAVLQDPGIGDNDALNPSSSYEHVLVHSKSVEGRYLCFHLDLCADETIG